MVTRVDICIWNKHDFQKKSRSKGIGDFLFWALREKWRRRENLQPWHKSVKLHCIVQPNIIFIKNILQGQIISYSIQSRTSATESYCKTTRITLISLQSHPPCTFFRGGARGGAEELLYGGDLPSLLVGFLLLKLGEGGERGLRVGLWRLSLRGTVTAGISRLLFSLQPVTGNTSLRQSVRTSFLLYECLDDADCFF